MIPKVDILSMVLKAMTLLVVSAPAAGAYKKLVIVANQKLLDCIWKCVKDKYETKVGKRKPQEIAFEVTYIDVSQAYSVDVKELTDDEICSVFENSLKLEFCSKFYLTANYHPAFERVFGFKVLTISVVLNHTPKYGNQRSQPFSVLQVEQPTAHPPTEKTSLVGKVGKVGNAGKKPRRPSRKDLSPEEKAERRRKSNNLAAKKSREQNKQHLANLELKVKCLDSENKRLNVEIISLRKENEQLRTANEQYHQLSGNTLLSLEDCHLPDIGELAGSEATESSVSFEDNVDDIDDQSVQYHAEEVQNTEPRDALMEDTVLTEVVNTPYKPPLWSFPHHSLPLQIPPEVA